MNEDDSRKKPAPTGQEEAIAPDSPFESAPDDRRLDPLFTSFDEEYEESERDTDYASAYEEDEFDAEELDAAESLEDLMESPEVDDPADDSSTIWQAMGGGSAAAGSLGTTRTNPWDVRDLDTADEETDLDAQGHGRQLLEDDDGDEDLVDEDPDEDWNDEQQYLEEPEELEIENRDTTNSLPMGLLVIGLIALVLLAAGGYGVIQQRSAAQEEIRRLQAALATAASPAGVAATREALREMEQRTAENLATIEALTLKNASLTDTVAGLEMQLAAVQAGPLGAEKSESVAANTAATPSADPIARPTTAPAVTAKTPKAAGTATSAAGVGEGDWFVNFSSYSLRSAADKWVKNLNPSAGKAVVIPTTKDGKTYYRVRIVGLADRAQADKVAGQLQSAHKLPPLWVGRD